jgi:hypothetical protein
MNETASANIVGATRRFFMLIPPKPGAVNYGELSL